MTKRILVHLVASWSFVAMGLSASTRGTIQDDQGVPIPDARICVVDTTHCVFSDETGRFALDIPSNRARLSVEASRHLPLSVTVCPGSGESLQITLTRLFHPHDEVVVTERVASRRRVPPASAIASVTPSAVEIPLTSVASLATVVPGVALNGQGGRAQVPSIRGISGHRILTSVAGVRVMGERRAGVSADFLDPFLIGRLGIIRGPFSGLRGGGALGGVIEVLPREFHGTEAQSGFYSQGRQTALGIGWGDERYSIGAAVRTADNSHDRMGRPVNDHFTSYSTLLTRNWARGDRSFQLSVISSLGTDAGKAANDFPETITTYPVERHLLADFRTDSPTNWNYSAGFHGQSLKTRRQEGESTSEVLTDSWDFQLDAVRAFQVGAGWSGEFSIDYFGRRSVDSRESSGASGDVAEALKSGLEDDAGLSVALRRQFHRVGMEAGTRFSLFRQSNAGRQSVRGTSVDGFLGTTFSLLTGLDLNLSLGTGVRYPSLSERFYTGTTGRGVITGDPSLRVERSLAYEGGVTWVQDRLFLSARSFGTRIRDYVERIEIEPDAFTYRNLTGGLIKGIEWEAAIVPRSGWLVSLRGHTLRGKDREKAALADIPVDRLELGLSRRTERWESGLLTQLRGPKRTPASGEVAIGGVVLLSPFMNLSVGSGLQVVVAVNNLLDRFYFETADKKAAAAPGRSFFVGLSWKPD